MITNAMRVHIMAQDILKDCFHLCEDLDRHIEALPQMNEDLMCLELGADNYLKLRTCLKRGGYDKWIDNVLELTGDYFDVDRPDAMENHRIIFWAAYQVTRDVKMSHDQLYITYLKLRRGKKV